MNNPNTECEDPLELLSCFLLWGKGAVGLGFGNCISE